MTTASLCSLPAVSRSMAPRRGLDERGRAELNRLIGRLPFKLHGCQMEALDALADGRDVVASIGTGWGKTLIYIIFAIASGGTCILVTPLLTLRDDQLREINTWGARLGLTYELAIKATVADKQVQADTSTSADASTPANTSTPAPAQLLQPQLCDCANCEKQRGADAARKAEGHTDAVRGRRRFPCLCAPQALCPNRHKLQRSSNSTTLKCDDCLNPVASSVSREGCTEYITWACASCDFDRCSACVGEAIGRRGVSQSEQSPSEATPTAAPPPKSASSQRNAPRPPPTRTDVEALDPERRLLESRSRVYLITPEALGGSSWLAQLRRRALSESPSLTLFVVDEAHCISMRSFRSFRPEYGHLGRYFAQLRENYVRRHGSSATLAVTLACSGTLPSSVQREVVQGLQLPADYSSVHGPLDRPNVALLAVPPPAVHRGHKSWAAAAADLFELTWRTAPQWARTGLTMVYVAFKRHARALRKELQQRRWLVHSVHGDLDASERSRRSAEWARGDVHIKVSTAADGMGLNLPNVTLLVVLEFSSGVMDAWQKWGRVARDFSLPGLVVAWLQPRFLIERFALTEPGSEAKGQLLKLLSVLTDPRACLRKSALSQIDGRGGDGLCMCSACLAGTAGPALAQCAATAHTDADARMASALTAATNAAPALRVSQLVQEPGCVNASEAVCDLLHQLQIGGGDWQRLQAVMHQPGSRAPTGLFSTLAGHGQLVLRMVAVEALELDLRPNAFAKGSVAFVRPSASWLEGLLGGDGDYSVDVVLWGCGTATQAALDSRQKSKGQILRRMRQLHLADLRLAAELKRLEEGFFDAGGDWTADLEPRLREWVDRRSSSCEPAQRDSHAHGFFF